MAASGGFVVLALHRGSPSWKTSRTLGWIYLFLLSALSCGAGEWKWSQMSTGAPTVANFYTRVFWTGHELLVWGAANPDSAAPYVHRAWRWNPRTRAIKSMSLVNAPPVPVYGQSALWTGRHLLVWGGQTSGDPESASREGHVYDPLTDSWKRISTVHAPSGRSDHGAVWTGREMFVWGGWRSGNLALDYGAYNMQSNQWRFSSGVAGMQGRLEPRLVFTGKEILLWGGWSIQGDWSDLHNVYYRGLYRLTAETGDLSIITVLWSPPGRAACATVWTGNELIVWGGYNGPTYGDRTVLSDGYRYVHSEGRWYAMNPDNPLGPRERPGAVWTGKEVILWGGLGRLAPGGRYDPRLDLWEAIGTNGAPSDVQWGNLAWAGDMVLAAGDDVFALAPEGTFRADGLPDDWQMEFFGSSTSGFRPTDDPDADGWSNDLEWRFGTNPVNDRSHPAATITLSGDTVAVRFPDPDPLLTIVLEYTTRLEAPFVPMLIGTRSDGKVLWNVETVVNGAQFFRVVVKPPAL